MKTAHFVSVFVMFMVIAGALEAQNQKVILTSLEWPPYTSEALPDQGASSAVAVAAFKAMGYDLTIKFMPWERAVDMAKNDTSVMGYFPEYYSKDNATTFLYSDPMGQGPLGFVEPTGSPVKWSTLDDVKGLTIGVVEGYLNTDEFDARVVAHTQKVEAVSDDATNVAKVAAGRIPLAVIDGNVLNYLVLKDKSVIPYRNQVHFNGKILANKSLYVCFKNTPDGQKLAKIYNAGLKKIDVSKIMTTLFYKLKD